MKRIGVILWMVFSLNIIVNAQVNDPKAVAILDKVVAKIKTFSSMKIDFTYKLENKKEKLNETQKGTITIKGNKFHLEVKGQHIYCDGKTVWTFIPDAEEVQVNNLDPKNDDAINPNTLLATWQKNYRAKLIRETKEKGVVLQFIDLVPIKGKSYFKVRLVIDKDKQQIARSEVYDKNGSIYTYQVDKFIPNVKVTDADFAFNPAKHPGIEVNDMR